MANISNNMIITNESLSQISKRLIEHRTYKIGTIEIIGNLQVINGIATEFSVENYCKHSGLTFNNDSINTSFYFSGTIINSDEENNNCALTLKGNGELKLQANYSSIELIKDNIVIAELSGFNLGENSKINCTALFEGANCTLTLFNNNKKYSSTTILPDVIDFSKYSTLLVGNNENNNFWEGSIDLATVGIKQDDILVYAPSVISDFKFSKIIISDGKYPLTNSSGPILNHVYEYPVTEITRTNNNILITATIAEDSYLTIKEVGLYYEDDLGVHLFSYISGLSVAKRKDLGYNLIIQVKLDVNVVNTITFPIFNIKKEEYVKFSDFKTVKEVYAYTVENLERMIKTNALGIGSYTDQTMTDIKPVGVGYNTAQEYYRYLNDFIFWRENFGATFNFTNLKNKFSGERIYSYRFDPTELTAYGTAQVEEETGIIYIPTTDEVRVNAPLETLIVKANDVYVNESNETLVSNIGRFTVNEAEGIMSNSTISGRFEINTFTPRNINVWDFTICFTTPSIIADETLMNFAGYGNLQPMVLGLRNGYCYAQVNEKEILQLKHNDANFFFTRAAGINTINDVSYYIWKTNQVDQLGFDKIYTKDVLPTSTTNYYDVEGNELNNFSFVQVYGNRPILDMDLFSVEAEETYTVQASFNGNTYEFLLIRENMSPILLFSYNSTKETEEVQALILAAEFDGKDDYIRNFSGSLDMMKFKGVFKTYNERGIIDQTLKCNFVTSTFVETTDTLSYYYIPETNKSYIKINDLGTSKTSNEITVCEELLIGQNDAINFESESGFTLCLKILLNDLTDKIILRKKNESSVNYFEIKEQNSSLVFSYNLGNGETLTFQKEISIEDSSSYLKEPITLTITSDGLPSTTFKMFRNNELIAMRQTPYRGTLIAEDYSLTNQVDNENEVLVVKDIICFNGDIGEDGIYLVNELLDTNF